LLGDDEWVKGVEGMFKQKWGEREIPWHQRLAARVSLDQIFANRSADRDQLISHAYFDHGYKMREIGEYLHISKVRVSQILKSAHQDLTN